MLIFGANRNLARWAGERLGIPDFGPCSTIGVVKNNSLAAVLVYNNYRPPNIEMSLATSTPYWASREVLGAIFRYPFVQLGCKRVTAVMAEGNVKGRAFVVRLGFTLEGFHPDMLPTGAAISYGMLRAHAARWIGED